MKKKKNPKVVTVDMYHKYAEIDEMYSSKVREVNLDIPSNLRMLCAILDIKVEKLLNDFMWMLSYSHHNSATPKQRKIAKKFFLACKYGQPLYTKKQIKQMFDELKADRKIRKTIDGMDHEDMKLFWKSNHMYMQHWFKRWFEKNRHKGDISILEEH
ncbi:hypothetical protein ACR78Z_17825 [Sphingobacterium thalpophilum]|uniref:hypothetical protein n=1 Tax=Sphingobacterium thalpophilum TaxID=259 RepID=UPI003DA1D7FE